MKTKLCLLTLIGLVFGCLAAWAQTTPPATDGSSAPAPATENPTPPAAPDTTPAQTDPAAAPADAAPAAAPADAPSAQPEPAALASAETEAGAQDAAAAAAAPVATDGTNAVPQPNAIIPLIVMDDVPLTDAIKNLARQAGLNYMLDPQIGFGQVGADGKPTPQPTVSIRWENVTAEHALTALLGNYNLQLTEDPKSKIARVTVRDPAAPDPLSTRIIQLKYAGPTNIISAVQSSLTDKRSKVVADVRTSQLVVLATEKELADVEVLVERLDTQTKQVLIEAHLVETSMNPSTIKGLDWTGTLQAQHLAFGNNLQEANQGSINRPLATAWPKMMFDTAKGFNPATAFLDADGVSAVFSFLNKNAEAKVLSAPRTVTLDNEQATISVTRASPIFKNTAGTQGSPGGSEVTYTNLGVILSVTPRISANDFVNLRVVPEVSRVFDTVTKKVADTINEADQYDIRKIDTRVMIPSGNTLVLGGLVQDDVRKGNTKVPVLGDIPGLGYLFRSDSKSRQKSNLLIFITPTIVGDEDFQPTKSTFLKTPAPNRDAVEDDWSAWDTGAPREWKTSSANDESQFEPVTLK